MYVLLGMSKFIYAYVELEHTMERGKATCIVCAWLLLTLSSQLQSLAADLESQLSADMLSLKSPLKPYLNDLASKHASMASLFHEVSQNGAALTELFKPTNEGARDNGRAGHISSQISTLNTHCQRVEQLWSDAWGRVGGGKPVRTSKTSSQSRQASDVGQPAVKVSQRIPSVASKTGKEITAKASVTRQTTASKPQQTSEDVAGARQTVGTSKTKHLTSPPMRQSSGKESEVLAVKASPKRQTPSSKRRSEMYGDLEAEAYKVRALNLLLKQIYMYTVYM